MSEWWTYRPSDFLMFAPRTYWRLFELHNQAWWPAPWLVLPAGLIGLAWLSGWGRRGGGDGVDGVVGIGAAARPPGRALRAGLCMLAVAWAAVGWFFLHDRFAPIHWVMAWGAWAFGAQALVLAALAWRPDLRPTESAAARRGGVLICAWALLVQPSLVLPFGRPWTQAEWLGLAPDPTVIATLGLLLWAGAASTITRGLLGVAWVLSLAWCVVSAATLWTMGSAQGWVPCAAGAAALALRWKARSAR